ncbi:hypothetical protein ACN47A_11520 [Myxococcus fulvus]|uniref:hypothetical protein n=1 Tax=Myxococcus fulvus TaxID=33 RepID=UPI003B9B91AC
MSRHLVLSSIWLLVGAGLAPSDSQAGPTRLGTDVPLRASMAEPLHASRPVRPPTPSDDGASTPAATLASRLGRARNTASSASADGTPPPGTTGMGVRARAAPGGLALLPPTTPSEDTPPLGASSTYQPTRPEDAPLSTGAWVAHGGLALLPLGGIWGATRVGGDTRLGATSAQTAAGMLGGYLPSRLLFFRPATPGSGRWMDLEVAAVGGGLLFTPPLAALGTWGMGELAFGRSEDRADAYLGALAGAAAGTLLAAAVDGLLTKLSEPATRLQVVRQLIALAFVGSGATLGYQWAGGGPRSHQPTR